MNSKKQITVVGAGVIGLSSAIRLLQEGHSVNIVAREMTPDTTSDVAAAFWCPYRVGPHDRAMAWARHTYQVFAEQNKDPDTGVHPSKQREIFKGPAEDPWYRELLQGYRRTSTEELPEGFVDGYEFDTYLVDTPVYMQYITAKVQALGARILETELQSLEELRNSCELIINCSGVWARQLVNDKAVYPIRGQVVVIAKLEDEAYPITTYDAGEFPAYIVPRKNDCLLGGTAQEENWDLEAHSEIAEGIRERCGVLNPTTTRQTVIKNKVGLRPGRKAVRLELDESMRDLPVIHNYGHGGSGFTLSWGCAEDVVSLVGQLAD